MTHCGQEMRQRNLLLDYDYDTKSWTLQLKILHLKTLRTNLD